MRLGNFVLSGINKCGVFINAGALSFFVRPLAPLSLRNFLCFRFNVLAHNKRKKCGPAGPDLATLGSCCGR